MKAKRILVAPLNWGLGHATRCVPIINELQKQEFEVVLASDGLALKYLTKEFPDLPAYALAPLQVTYAKTKFWQTANMFVQIPKLYRFIAQDKAAIERLVKTIPIAGLISDCRPGVFLKNIPSVYVNHQLKVKSGISTALSTNLHQNLMKNFDEIWVPDVQHDLNLSGELGHLKDTAHLPPIHYLGGLSRFSIQKQEKKYDYCAILSGPEPQRSIFQQKIEQLFSKVKGTKICITGKVEDDGFKNGITYRGLQTSADLNEVINASMMVISRSGYTSLMDFVKLKKSALLVPTPGQFEQEYLAAHMQEMNWFSVCHQDDLINLTTQDLVESTKCKLPNLISKPLDFSIFK